jgi:hypothetical protein
MANQAELQIQITADISDVQKDLNELRKALLRTTNPSEARRISNQMATISQAQNNNIRAFTANAREMARQTRQATESTRKSFESLKNVGSTMQGVGSSIQNVGQGLTNSITMPILGVGKASIDTAMNFEATMSKVQAISGATGTELKSLENKALEMGRTTKFSAIESAEALTFMGMAGWKTEEMLAGLPGIINLSAASGEDLAKTSDIVTDSLTGFGMTAGDTERFADILANTSRNANTNVKLMGETFKYVA